ncbi:prepilin-type N-terminal cleavage/methylation domain-containing protein [bacterium]|nr:prepilin-type N-terminal cleavage/methylation domain-containing protein [bacterium]
MFRQEKGFTLIEILIVIVVIGILAGIAIPSVRGMRDQAKMTQVDGDFRTLKTAIESYFARYDCYPGASGTEYGPDQSTTQLWETNLLNASPRLLEKELEDPFAGTKGGSYGFIQTGNRNWVLWSVGPNQTENDSDGDIAWTVGVTNSYGYESISRNDNEQLTITEANCDDIVISNVPIVRE